MSDTEDKERQDQARLQSIDQVGEGLTGEIDFEKNKSFPNLSPQNNLRISSPSKGTHVKNSASMIVVPPLALNSPALQQEPQIYDPKPVVKANHKRSETTINNLQSQKTSNKHKDSKNSKQIHQIRSAYHEIENMNTPPISIKQRDVLFLPQKDTLDLQIYIEDQPDFATSDSQQQTESQSQSRASSFIQKSSRPSSYSEQTSNSVPFGSFSLQQPRYFICKDKKDFLVSDSITLQEDPSLKSREHHSPAIQSKDINALDPKKIIKRALSPDQQTIALLTKDLDVILYLKETKQTLWVQAMSVKIRQLFSNCRYLPNLHVNDEGSKVCLHIQEAEIVVIWASQGVVTAKTIKNQTSIFQRDSNLHQNGSNSERQHRFFRSNSASKEITAQNSGQKSQERSSSRLKSFVKSIFVSPRRKASQDNSSTSQQKPVQQSLTNRSLTKNGNLPQKDQINSARQQTSQIQANASTQYTVRGHWTNVTINRVLDPSQLGLSLSQQFEVNLIDAEKRGQKAQKSTTPKIFGNNFTLSVQDSKQDECHIKQVALFESEVYFKFLEASLRNLQLQAELINYCKEDKSQSKILLLSGQKFFQDTITRGGITYPSPYFLVEKQTLALEVDFQGLLPESRSNYQILMKSDHSRTLQIIVLNSVHKFYCQVFFVNMQTKFASQLNLFEFVSAEDGPPFDLKGQTNLQVDDLAWSHSDAFVLLMLNSGALAVLPRLGNSLIRILNPTLPNVDYNDAHLYSQYAQPRFFNELFTNKVTYAQTKSTNQFNMNKKEYSIRFHPRRDEFTIYNGQILFNFNLQMQPELQNLFERQNRSFFFISFCSSMENLAKDPQILAQIPQLLTSKLPLLEFDKNVERYENRGELKLENRVDTCSQINPFQHQEIRMETCQSVEADFSEEPEIVLLNLKYLLFSSRWQGQVDSNYLQWLIEVVNDTFFFFLRIGDPMYAFHCLQIAEFYLKSVLYQTTSLNFFKLNRAGKRVQKQSSKPHASLSLLGLTENVQQLLKTQVDPVQDVFVKIAANQTKRLSCNGGQTDGLLSLLMGNEHLFVEDLPILGMKGNLNHRFQFQRNYLLLAFYNLIQFRNYQANNFNILFLILASFVMRNQINKSMVGVLKQLERVLFENFSNLDKTDEVDLFFGKTGRNELKQTPNDLEVYEKWTRQYTPFTNSFINKIVSKDGIHDLMNSTLNHMNFDKNQKACKSKGDKESQEQKEISMLNNFQNSLKKHDIRKVAEIISKASSNQKQNEENTCIRSPLQLLGIMVHLFKTQLFNYLQKGQQNFVGSTLNIYENLLALGIKIDKTEKDFENLDAIDSLLSQTSYPQMRPQSARISQQLKETLRLSSKRQLMKFLAAFNCYLGNYPQAGYLMRQKSDPNLLLFHILLLSVGLKSHSARFEQFSEDIQNKAPHDSSNLTELNQITELNNCVSTLKFIMSDLVLTFKKIQTSIQTSEYRGQFLHATFLMLPQGVSIAIREHFATDAIELIKNLLKHLSIVQKQKQLSNTPQPQTRQLLSQFKLVKSFFEHICEGNQGLIDHLFGLNNASDAFCRQLFASIETILVCLYDRVKKQSFLYFQQNKDQSLTFEDSINKNLVGLYLVAIKFTKIVLFVVQEASISQLGEAMVSEYSKKNKQSLQSKKQVSLKLAYIEAMLEGINFQKYLPIQMLIRKSIVLLADIITLYISHRDQYKEFQTKIENVISQFDFQLMSRHNKTLFVKLMDFKRLESDETNDPNIQFFQRAFEKVIYGSDKENSEDIKENLQNLVTKSFEKYTLLPFSSINFDNSCKFGQNLSIKTKKDLFRASEILNSKLGLSMTECSFYYNLGSLQRKSFNVFNLTDEDLKEFRDLCSSRQVQGKFQESEASKNMMNWNQSPHKSSQVDKITLKNQFLKVKSKKREGKYQTQKSFESDCEKDDDLNQPHSKTNLKLQFGKVNQQDLIESTNSSGQKYGSKNSQSPQKLRMTIRANSARRNSQIVLQNAPNTQGSRTKFKRAPLPSQVVKLPQKRIDRENQEQLPELEIDENFSQQEPQIRQIDSNAIQDELQKEERKEYSKHKFSMLKFKKRVKKEVDGRIAENSGVIENKQKNSLLKIPFKSFTKQYAETRLSEIEKLTQNLSVELPDHKFGENQNRAQTQVNQEEISQKTKKNKSLITSQSFQMQLLKVKKKIKQDKIVVGANISSTNPDAQNQKNGKEKRKSKRMVKIVKNFQQEEEVKVVTEQPQLVVDSLMQKLAQMTKQAEQIDLGKAGNFESQSAAQKN